MNFLAHALLAGDGPEDRLGGLIGDFVKGPLPAGLPPAVAAGVRLHRQIDVFADAHPIFLRSRGRISAARRRVSGVMVDMFYDHFLARHWTSFHPDPLERFTSRAYRLLADNAAILPPAMGRILPHMKAADWLASYRSVEAVGAALDRMSARLKRTDMLEGSGDELVREYAAFERDFFAFLPEAERYAARCRAARISEWE